MEENDIYDILKVILDLIKSKDFVWRLEGSANLRVQDVAVSVNDLDITTNNDGINLFRIFLKKFIVKDFYNEKGWNSLKCYINGFEVEINSYNNKQFQMFNKIKRITWNGLVIPILPLKNAREFYRLIDRKEKVDLIEKYL